MKKLKIMSILGTRPEAIKMAPLIKVLEKDTGIDSIVCVTAQHRQMLDQILNIFSIVPNYDLNIMRESQTLTSILTSALNGLEKVVIKERPDLILVHGDTSTTLSGSLIAFYNKIKLGHVEAGLRSHNKYEPFPEEINRVLTGKLADFHFAPTTSAKQNLINEGIKDNIFVTGNTAIDCLQTTLEENYKFKDDILNKLNYENKVILMTAHRRENIGKPLENICRAVYKIVNENKKVNLVYPVHLNPLVKNTVNDILSNHNRIHLIHPLDMKDMHNLMNRSYMILTDSGGIQEEAPSMSKPVVVLRNVTERMEGIEAGVLKLSGTDENAIYNITNELLNNNSLYNEMSSKKNPFGDGFASERILGFIKNNFELTKNKVLEYNI